MVDIGAADEPKRLDQLDGQLDEQHFIGLCIGENNRYRLRQHLSSGGMGDVFVAIDTSLNQPVAVKLLRATLSDAPDLLQRFERECAICAALKSPHIVQILDYGTTSEGYPFYVMEYLQGETLSQLLERSRLSVEQAITIAIQICAGLEVAHAGVMLPNFDDGTELGTELGKEPYKVIHRDLKPDNIFLVPTALGSLVKIIDFGVAKIRSLQQEAVSTTDIFLGTRHYAAPEQLELKQDLDERADIYSLGVMLYELLTGVDPFGFDFRHREVPDRLWLAAHLSQPPLPFQTHPNCQHLSPALEAVVMRCLAKSPQDRFASVSQLSQALQAALQAPPQTGPQTASQATNQMTSQTAMQMQTLLTANAAPSATHPHQHQTSNRLHTMLTLAAVLAGLSAIVAAIVSGLTLSQSSPLVESSPTANSSSPDPNSNPNSASNSSVNQSLSLRRTLAGHADSVWALAVSQNGQTLVSGSQDQTIKVWNLLTGQPTQILQGHQDAVRSLNLSADGQSLLSGSADQTVKLWDLSTGTLQLTANHRAPVWSVAFSRSQSKFASSSGDGKISIWDTNTGDLDRTIPAHIGIAYATAFSPVQETLLASGGEDRTLKLWNVETGNLVYELSGHVDAVRCVAFSETVLASGSWDKTIKLWDTESGKLLRTLTGHDDRVTAIAFSPDGKLLASASVDRTIKLWQVETGQLLQSVSGHADWVLSVAFSAQTAQASNAQTLTLTSSSKDKTIKLWQ